MWTLSNFCVVCFNYELFHGVHHHDVFAHDSGVLVRVSQQARRRFRMRSYAFLPTLHFPGGKRCLFPPQPHKLESFTISYSPYLTYSPCQRKCSVPQNKHLAKMQAQRFNFCIRQQAVISLPLLEYHRNIVEYVWKALLDIS
jgi:hypothetical protein